MAAPAPPIHTPQPLRLGVAEAGGGQVVVPATPAGTDQRPGALQAMSGGEFSDGLGGGGMVGALAGLTDGRNAFAQRASLPIPGPALQIVGRALQQMHRCQRLDSTWRACSAATSPWGSRRAQTDHNPRVGPRTAGRRPAAAPQWQRGRPRVAEHQDLVVASGWLSLLLACLQFDLGDRDATRPAEMRRSSSARRAAMRRSWSGPLTCSPGSPSSTAATATPSTLPRPA
jgi:hypothetical protein